MNITGIILAGGKSSRMGKDKSFIRINGKFSIEIIIHKLSSVFSDLLIITNNPDKYIKYGIEIQTDIKLNCGPLGGIYTGLVNSKNKFNFVIGCDMPFLNIDLIKFMSTKITNCDALVPCYKNKIEPLNAFYSKTCIKRLKYQLQKDDFKVKNFLKHIKKEIITEDEIMKFDSQGSCFVNINTIEDYQKIKI